MPEGKRGLGRPKMRWLDGVDQDSKRTRVERVETGMNGKSLRKATAHLWLSS